MSVPGLWLALDESSPFLLLAEPILVRFPWPTGTSLMGVPVRFPHPSSGESVSAAELLEEAAGVVWAVGDGVEVPAVSEVSSTAWTRRCTPTS